ncbi:MAG: acetyl-CoA carboxylase biotin carboxylase subunit [Myxococcota bacterium]|nr:acetyl-CoA carboxylase biotin carboxylase subunit [Myxococcota bacterium]
MFERVLVANRGEIAVRVMRTLREMGISPIAIYSEADRHSLHVRMADQAVCVGPEASSASYLVIDAVLDAARRTGAQAIHPGYGFLSENAEFAKRVIAAGISWIGPPPAAIEAMGDKLIARRTVVAAGVPVVPGLSEPITDPDSAAQYASEIGFPVMLKASAGGGGKGMRLVQDPADFRKALDAAKREAASAFGNDAVYLEKFISEPHHVEIQILCDTHGNAIHVGERECSVQRRHQKVIEEAPSPFITEETRQKMGLVAVEAAKACQYVGAGTVEFLVGGDQGFYFLEMNTRLQVEHPVTELVYGVDLVAQQVRVAAGLPLSFTQADLVPRGHALECRIYAEDPDTFMPCPGDITALQWPSGPGVRVDAGVDVHSVVPMAYDPMIAKICTWAPTREHAIQRMHRVLDETVILGLTTNIPLHHRILAQPDFKRGRYDTSLLNGELPTVQRLGEPHQADAIAAAAIARYENDLARTSGQGLAPGGASPWLSQGRSTQLGG